MARISFLFYSEEFNTIFLRSLDLDVAKVIIPIIDFEVIKQSAKIINSRNWS